jgi:hypothetical protein
MEEMETHPNPFGKPTEMRHSQKTSLAMGEYPQGILANIQKWDIDTFHYQRTADIGRVSVNPESLHQIASQLREPPYAERHVRWCERSENESRKKTTSFSSYSIIRTPDGVRFQIFNSQRGKFPFGSPSPPEYFPWKDRALPCSHVPFGLCPRLILLFHVLILRDLWPVRGYFLNTSDGIIVKVNVS